MGGGSSKKKKETANMSLVVPGQSSEKAQSINDQTKIVAVDAPIDKDVKEKLMWVFSKYDRDRSGALDTNEILELMVEIQSVTDDELVNETKFTHEDAKTVLKALDTDENGVVEDVEFLGWIEKGLQMTADEFEDYMRSGPTQHQLASFLLGVKLYCTISYKIISTKS